PRWTPRSPRRTRSPPSRPCIFRPDLIGRLSPVQGRGRTRRSTRPVSVSGACVLVLRSDGCAATGGGPTGWVCTGPGPSMRAPSVLFPGRGTVGRVVLLQRLAIDLREPRLVERGEELPSDLERLLDRPVFLGALSN